MYFRNGFKPPKTRKSGKQNRASKMQFHFGSSPNQSMAEGRERYTPSRAL